MKKHRTPNKVAASAVLSAQVAMYLESGGKITIEKEGFVPARKNFGFDALNKSRSCGAGRGGKSHNAGLPRTVR